MASLSNEVIKLSTIREVAKQELESIIDRIGPASESKCVFAEKELCTLLARSEVSLRAFSKERGVVSVTPLSDTFSTSTTAHAVYFVPADVNQIRLLVAHLLTFSKKNPQSHLHVFFVPHKSLMVEHILMNEYKLTQAIPNLRFGEFDLDLIPLDDDLLTMAMPMSFKQLYVDGDMHCLNLIARTIIKLQTARFGPIPVIRGKGNYAARVVNMVRQLQQEVGTEFLTELTPEVEALYVVDRSVDLVTPLMSQLTYEGLIDELYGVDCGELNKLPSTATQTGGKPISLTSDDRIFSEIRDRNYITVGGALHEKSLWVKQSYERRKEVQHLKELKEFMKGLPEMQETHRLISVHTEIATEIGKITQSAQFRKRVSTEQAIVRQSDPRDVLQYIDDQICQSEPLDKVLRLLCLYSVVNGGIKPKVYDAFKETLMHVYGIPQMMATLFCLDRAELLVRQDSRVTWNYTALRTRLKVWHEDLKEQQPNDASYAYSGYAPLLTRVVEGMVTNPQGWYSNNDSDVTDLVPGEKAEVRNGVDVPGNVHVVLIVVIGGLTYAEMGTLRFIQSALAKRGEPKQLVVVTTHMTTGSTMLQSIIPFTTL